MCPFRPSENVHEYIWSCWTACFHVDHPPSFGATLLSGASELYHQWGHSRPSQKPSMPAHPCTNETSATHQTQTLEGSSHKRTHRTSVRLEMGSGVDVRCRTYVTFLRYFATCVETTECTTASATIPWDSGVAKNNIQCEDESQCFHLYSQQCQEALWSWPFTAHFLFFIAMAAKQCQTGFS